MTITKTWGLAGAGGVAETDERDAGAADGVLAAERVGPEHALTTSSVQTSNRAKRTPPLSALVVLR
jgi:hypothetical protein